MAIVLPPFATEMGLPAHRSKLRWSIGSGYAICATFAFFAWLADITELYRISIGVMVLIAIKLIANSLAAWSLRIDRGVLLFNALNVLADIITLTGAIYVTGGIASPLLPVYGIELTVIALLTNVGVTVATGIITFVCYASMVALVRFGALEPPMPLLDAMRSSGDTHLLIAVSFAAFVIGLPTAFAAGVLQRLRQQEAALRARTEQLVDASQQKSQFMANITHELRTPIHGICGLADLVDAGVYGPVTDQQKSAAHDIKGSALSLLRLIDDLLTLAREDAGRLEYRPTEIDLDEVLASVMATVGFLRGTRKLEVTLHAEPSLPKVTTDRSKLVQILVNLLANAVKFTDDGGRVILRARALNEDQIDLSVEDNGIGIAASELPHVFEPFRQADGSTERRYGGAGLGLALVDRLTTLLGGEIRVTSREGVGSTFNVVLPIRRSS